MSDDAKDSAGKDVSVSDLEDVLSERDALIAKLMDAMRPGITASIYGATEFLEDELLDSRVAVLEDAVADMTDIMNMDNFSGEYRNGYQRAISDLEDFIAEFREALEERRAEREEKDSEHDHAHAHAHVHSPACYADPSLKGPLWFVMIDERDGWEGGWKTKDEAFRVCQNEFDDLDEVLMCQFDTSQFPNSDYEAKKHRIEFLVEPFQVKFVDDLGAPLLTPKEVVAPKKVLS